MITQLISTDNSLHRFDADNHLAFKKRLFSSLIYVSMIFSALFGVMHYLQINLLNDFHANVNFLYSATNALIIIALRTEKIPFQLSVLIYLVASLLTFTSAYLNITEDQFRGIWFYLLAFVAYIVADNKTGKAIPLISLFIMLVCQYFSSVQFSGITFTSMFIGLFIFGLITQAFTQRVRDYVELLNEQNQQLNELAKLDHLTGIFNSRHFHEFGQKLINLARRNNEPLSLIFIDLDHFKNVNDLYGHLVGDKLLVQVSKSIENHLRTSDMFARTGGEEFCILLPKTTASGASELAEKLRLQIEKEILKHGDLSISITASIGISTLKPDQDNLIDMQSRADKCLYIAKSRGRNQVVFQNV